MRYIWNKLGATKLLGRAVKLVWASGPGWMMASLCLVVLGAVLPLASLWLLGRIVDSVTHGAALAPGSPREAAWHASLLWVGLAGVVALISSLCTTATTFVSEGQGLVVARHMSALVQRQAARMDLEYFENAEFFNTLHRAQEEAPFRPTRIVNGLTGLGQNLVSLFAIGALLVTLHPLVPFVLLISVLPGLLVRLRFVSILWEWTLRSTPVERRASYFNYLLTLEPFAKEVRLFEMAPFFGARFDAMRLWLAVGRLRVARRRMLADGGVQLFVIAPTFALLAFIASQTFAGVLSLGALVMYFGAIQRAQGAMQGTFGAILSLHEDTTFLSLLYRFLDLQPKLVAPTPPKAVPAPWQSGLQVENLSFAYPNSDRQALYNVSLSVAPGEVVALVGENGSGKTTLVKLLCRLYDPDSGAITLDGIDARDCAPEEWRRGISAVFQDYNHYSLTLAENIWLGDLRLPSTESDAAMTSPEHREQMTPATRRAVEESATRAGVDRIAARLPKGLDTLLGRDFDGGEELSIGQWQKIALARAFLRPSQLLILDEPSSALDPRAEAELFDSFRELIRGRAALLISHRLSTVRLADSICVLDKGVIVARGTHDELIAQGGLYAQLFETQAQSYR
ncbi:lipid A export ATP-binding/permease protein MsbA [Abditibacteriota bacterium]|nr:lipid A export ATP-binding/permease protein MsbA [Abditibacteriota bacterium]